MATIYTNISSNKRRSFLLILLFVVFLIGLGYIFARALDMYWLFPVAIFIAGIQAVSSYWWSDKMVLAISGAKPIDKATNLELYRIVENIAITAGLPMPKLYVIEDTAPNAFATGRDPNHAVICVTSGLVQKLNKQELEAVIAHEFSHIGNFDIRLATIVVILVGIVVLISDWFLRISFFGGGDDDNNNGNAYFMIIGLVLALLSPLFAVLIQLALSRKREYLADADGALLTRNPQALASALEKISDDKEPLEAANKATAHLYLADPIKDHKGALTWFAGLFNTHPPIPERVRRLREMAL